MEKITHKKCKTCRYYGVTMRCCDYAELTGQLRTVKDHEIVVPAGYCDKYEMFESANKDRSAERRAIWMEWLSKYK